jgi:hypothetical protein
MVALPVALAQSGTVLNHLVKRKKNWAAIHPGVILVFAIVFTVFVLVVGLFVQKRLAARRASKETN